MSLGKGINLSLHKARRSSFGPKIFESIVLQITAKTTTTSHLLSTRPQKYTKKISGSVAFPMTCLLLIRHARETGMSTDLMDRLAHMQTLLPHLSCRLQNECLCKTFHMCEWTYRFEVTYIFIPIYSFTQRLILPQRQKETWDLAIHPWAAQGTFDCWI